MAEGARWGTPPKHYKEHYRPLADFAYLWEAPHFQGKKNQITQDKVTKRKAWEKLLPTMTPKGDNAEILVVYQSVILNGLINPLSCIEQDGVLYPVKGNQRLCALRAIKLLVAHRHLSKLELSPMLKQWVDKQPNLMFMQPNLGQMRVIGKFNLDKIPCRVADYREYPDDWTHDHPVARNHIGDEVKFSG